MTVAELIELLEKFPPEMLVWMRTGQFLDEHYPVQFVGRTLTYELDEDDTTINVYYPGRFAIFEDTGIDEVVSLCAPMEL